MFSMNDRTEVIKQKSMLIRERVVSRWDILHDILFDSSPVVCVPASMLVQAGKPADRPSLLRMRKVHEEARKEESDS